MLFGIVNQVSMPVYWLSDKELYFPPAYMTNEDGILAIGGDLSVERLVLAYQNGIFPWFNPNDPIIWWSPDPRFVLYPSELKVAKSMRPYFNQKKFRLTVDQHFEKVIYACQRAKRPRQSGGTWITDDMVEGYVQLHKQGFAHSIEVWKKEELVGGLYGVALGKVFFGESMFSKVSNASKFGFISLVRKLETLGFNLIDCQQPTRYLSSMGARKIPRAVFLKLIQINQKEATLRGNWSELLQFS